MKKLRFFGKAAKSAATPWKKYKKQHVCHNRCKNEPFHIYDLRSSRIKIV